MTVISTDNDYITNVTIFTTTPEQQQNLLEVVLEGEEKLKEFPGLVSTSIHLSLDGKSIISYAQWESMEAFGAMRDYPPLADNLKQVRSLVSNVSLTASKVAYTLTRPGY